MSWKNTKNNSGITAVPLIIALLLLTAIAGVFVSLMFGRHMGAPLLAQTTKAFYIADAGIEFTEEYLKDNKDWLNLSPVSPTAFGGGTFEVEFSNPNSVQNSVIATSTGTINDAVRVISINFTRSILAFTPVAWLTELDIEDATISCEGPSLCDPIEPLNDPPFDCLCTYQATLQETPPLSPPAGLPAGSIIGGCPSPGVHNDTVSLSADCIFAQGTYFFDRLILEDNVNVIVSGPVTIWIQDRFRMRDGSTFNSGNSSANVLILAAQTATFEDPKFELNDNIIFSGAIYAPPNADRVRLKNSVQFVGAMVGNEIDLRDNANVLHDPDAVSNTEGYALTVPPRTLGWGEI